MSGGSGSRKRYLEFMYIFLYVMVILNGDKKEDSARIDFKTTLAQIYDLKKDIEISCEDISSLMKVADGMSESFENNEELKKVSEEVKSFYDMWENYHKNTEKKTEELILSGGGYDDNMEIKNPENTESVTLFIKENHFDTIKKYVEDIYNKINDYDFSKDDKAIQGILKALKYFEFFGSKAENEDTLKEFSETFANKTLAELVYFLYIREYSMSLYTKIVLDKLMKTAELSAPAFNSFELIVIPKRETVIAGKNYEATVYLNAKDYVKVEGEEPIVKVNGVQVDTEKYVANIVYPTSRKMEFDEEGKHVVNLKIEYFQKNPYSNNDIELEKIVKFTVINKNEFEGQTKTANIFYKHCSNEFIIKNEDPELNNSVTYDVRGGRIISMNNIDRNNTSLVIYPTSDDCEIIVKNNNEEVRRFKNKTTETPMPIFDFYVNDRQIVDQMELYDDDIQSMSIEVSNEEEFEKKYPLDSVNVVKDWTIEFKNSKKKTFHTISVTNSEQYQFTADDKRKIARECSYIYIRANNIVRQHKDSKGSSNIEEIPLIKPYELLARNIKILHKRKNTKSSRRRGRRTR